MFRNIGSIINYSLFFCKMTTHGLLILYLNLLLSAAGNAGVFMPYR